MISILRTFGFVPHDQRGSHVKLRRAGPNGEKQTLVVPLHGELDRGTVHAIFRQATRYISPSDLPPHFFFED